MGIFFLFSTAIASEFICGGLSHPVVDQFHPAPTTLRTQTTDQYDPIDWDVRAQNDLDATLNRQPKVTRAKNVILFIGDGMGLSTQTAARVFSAQNITLEREEDGALSWETFPYTGLAKTYSTNRLTPDSSSTATAFMSGQKCQTGTVGVQQSVTRGDCSSSIGNNQYSFINQAISEGRWTGVVTTTRVTHATPASAYAHSADRDWEWDTAIPAADRNTCKDIAHQLIHGDNNTQIRVVLGGGRQNFLPINVTDPEYASLTGFREDNRDLTQEWKDLKLAQSTDYAYVENKADFDRIDETSVNYILGLFEPDHMKYETERQLETPGSTWDEPSLADMVTKSIGMLRRSDSGYVLLVEGGRIDHAHHESNAARSLRDTVALSDAVRQATQLTSEDDTLIILTADHSHTFAVVGYPDIRKSVLDIVTEDGALMLGEDGLPYLTLSYANGQGAYTNRSTLLDQQATGALGSVDFMQNALVPTETETHAGEDVAIYARGPFAHIFTGLHEQNYIAHAIKYATCLGENNYCDTSASSGKQPNTAIPMVHVTVILILAKLVI